MPILFCVSLKIVKSRFAKFIIELATLEILGTEIWEWDIRT